MNRWMNALIKVFFDILYLKTILFKRNEMGFKPISIASPKCDFYVIQTFQRQKSDLQLLPLKAFSINVHW